MQIKLRTLFLLVMLSVVCLVSVTYTVLTYQIHKKDVLQDANVRLLTAGHFARVLAGAGYHDRILSPASISKEEFDRLVALYDEQCQKLGLQYIWSLMELDGKIVFTSATHSILTNRNSACASFLEVHSNPEFYRHAFATMRPEFSTFRDKWGEGRMVLLPAWDQRHRKYLFAASVRLADYDKLLRKTLMEAVLASIPIGAFFGILVMALARMITRPLTHIANAVTQLSQGKHDTPLGNSQIEEVVALATAFESMRQTLRRQMEDLRASEARFRSLVDNLSIGVALISPKMEVLSLNRQMRTWYPHIPAECDRPICHTMFNRPSCTEVCSYCPAVKTLYDGEVHEAITETLRGTVLVNYRIVSSPIKDTEGHVLGVIEMVEDITTRKRIENALRDSQANLSAIMESTTDLIFSLDIERQKLLQFNTAFAREIETSYGVRVQTGMVPHDILPPQTWPVWEQMFQQAVQNGAGHVEYQRPGDLKYFDIKFGLIRNEQRVSAVSVFIRDITERKQVEQSLVASESKLQVLFNILPVGISIINHEHKVVCINPTLEKILGLSEAELRAGLHAHRQYLRGDGTPMPPEEIPSVRALREHCDLHNVELGVVKEDGATAWVSVSVAPLPGEGVAIATQDITVRKQTERSLQDNEVNFRTFFETVTDLILVATPEARILHHNSAVPKYLGYTHEELMGMHLLDLHPPERRQEAMSIFAAMLSGETVNCPLPIAHKDGTLIPVDTRVWRGKWNGLDCIYGICKNLTAEQEAQHRFERLFRSSPALIALSTLSERRFVDVNDSFLQVLGFSKSEVIGKTSTELGLLPNPEQRSELATRLLNGKSFSNIEIDVRCKDGRILNGLFSGELIISQGQLYYFTLMLDITARKQAEEALHQSRAQLAAVLESTQDMIWSVDVKNFAVLEFNSAFADFIQNNFGLTLKRGMTAKEILPTKRYAFWEQQLRHAQTKKPCSLEYQIPDRPIYLEVFFNPILADDEVISISIFARNIAARKQAEAELAASENRLRAFLDNSAVIGWMKDAEGRHVFVSDNLLRRFKGHIKDWIGKTDFELRPRLVAENLRRNDEAVLAKGQTIEAIEQVPNADGSQSWWLVSKFLFEDTCGKRFVGGLGVDITDRKRAEDALRESQAHLTTVFESTDDLIWSVNANTLDLLTFNPAFAEEILCTYGVRVKPGMNLRDFLPAERVVDWERLLQRATREGRFTDEFFRPNHPKYFERTFNPIVKAGHADSVSIFARDISARKRTDLALRESEGKFTRLAEHIENVLYSVDAVTREFRYLSPAFERMFGYTSEDIKQMGGRRRFLAHVIQADEFPAQDHYLEQLRAAPRSLSFRTESWWRCKDGSLRRIQDHWMPVYEEGQLVSTEGVMSDVTKERASEEKLRESESLLKEAQRLAKLGSWNWDLTTGTVTWSEELHSIWRLAPSQTSEALAVYMNQFLPKSLRDAGSSLKQASLTGEDYAFETEFTRHDESRGHLLVHGTSVRGTDGRIIRLHGTVQDISDRKRLEQQILEISEREQRRIGHDLHDGVGQQLTALRFLSSALRQKLLEQKQVAPAEFERLENMLAMTIQEVRGLARGLHPVNADSQGLMHGLRELCRTLEPIFGILCTFECDSPVLIHDQNLALNLYRIAQEATRNAATHGAPKHINLRLEQQEGMLRLTISDDGRGLPHDRKNQGLGLEIMHYRARAIGASLAVDNRPGEGVTITCELAARG